MHQQLQASLEYRLTTSFTVKHSKAMSTTTITSTQHDRARVLSVSRSSSHTVSKSPAPFITLVAGLGVQGDCHSGRSVQHQSLLHANPGAINLRQIHLVSTESLRHVSARLTSSKPLSAGEIGENVTTEGIDLPTLPRGTELHFVDDNESGDRAIIVLTGLRNPGPGINKCRPGLQALFAVRSEDHKMAKHLAGVMATVKAGGVIRPGMTIKIVRPSEARPLAII
ncbi:MOSC domain-containing protein [Aspergillus affinis]|uniref:MOSC domain-containing protein n=1 Tax=Aspergillus affinis TaxID=1070780 RepID=UPI0022FE1238|nr:uncharacterized protein KD926_006021 [Aspergillus affinis]KAI9046074.1 hypothetical protein KD926_006021 [Aspergillus affinis]